MEDVFEKNMSALEEERPDFFLKLRKVLESKQHRILTLSMKPTKEAGYALIVEKGGKQIRLNSIYRPVQEAERWGRQYEYRYDNMNIMMFGMGNLLFVYELRKRMQADSRLFLYEPSVEIFDYVIHTDDMTALFRDERVFFYLVGVNEENFYYDLAKRTHWSNIETQIDCFHPGYPELFGKEYNRFGEWIIQCDTTEIVNRNTGAEFSKIYVKNILKNIPFILDGNSIFELKGCFDTEVPAILVAAGPSLGKNIHNLKAAEGRAFVIATDTSVRYLVKEKIKFDAMITVDPRKPVEYLQVPECREIPLFCNLAARAEILNYHTGRKIWFREPTEYLKHIYSKFGKEFPYIDAGANVAASAWTVSRVLGFKRIILVGQDLAYVDAYTHVGEMNDGLTADGKSYREGKERNSNISDCKKNIYVDGVDGHKVQTREDWKLYLEWYEREVKKYRETVETIDATEGGAMIHGTEMMLLKEAVERYCKKEFDFMGILSKQPASFKNCRTRVKRELLNMKKELRLVGEKLDKIIELENNFIEQMLMEPDHFDMGYYVKEISAVNAFITKQSIQSVLTLYVEKESEEIVKKTNGVPANTTGVGMDMAVSMRDYHRLLSQAVIEIEPYVEQMTQEVERKTK